jgi:malate/lactate dehydrogenase
MKNKIKNRFNKNYKKEPQREYATRFDLVAHSTSAAQDIADALNQGFEPFGISNSMVQKPASKLSLAGETPKPDFQMDTVVWFKRGQQVPLMTQAEVDAAKLDELEKEQTKRDEAQAMIEAAKKSGDIRLEDENGNPI